MRTRCGLLVLALLVLPATAPAQYSDASLLGPWTIVTGEVVAGESPKYVVFDGLGTIEDFGVHNAPDSAGNYSVDPDGSYDGYLWSDGYVYITGQIYTDSTADMTFDVGFGEVTAPLIRFTDPARCQGTWTGAFVQDCTDTTYNVELTIDANGEIVSATGFAGPVNGRFYYQPYYLLSCYMSTGETEPGWNSILIEAGSLVGDASGATIAGRFSLDGGSSPYGTFSMERGPLTAVDQPREIVDAYFGLRSFPNPFNPVTTIYYELPHAAHAHLSVYDVQGRLVRTLVNEPQVAGSHALRWEADGLGAGLYFYRLQAGEHSAEMKCLLVK